MSRCRFKRILCSLLPAFTDHRDADREWSAINVVCDVMHTSNPTATHVYPSARQGMDPEPPGCLILTDWDQDGAGQRGKTSDWCDETVIGGGERSCFSNANATIVGCRTSKCAWNVEPQPGGSYQISSTIGGVPQYLYAPNATNPKTAKQSRVIDVVLSIRPVDVCPVLLVEFGKDLVTRGIDSDYSCQPCWILTLVTEEVSDTDVGSISSVVDNIDPFSFVSSIRPPELSCSELVKDGSKDCGPRVSMSRNWTIQCTEGYVLTNGKCIEETEGETVTIAGTPTPRDGDWSRVRTRCSGCRVRAGANALPRHLWVRWNAVSIFRLSSWLDARLAGVGPKKYAICEYKKGSGNPASCTTECTKGQVPRRSQCLGNTDPPTAENPPVKYVPLSP
ncbi:hypothetical protein DFH09DRAFT_1074848 [Mycena vulgaris]|nr:hypothetical protein DFH09DRAFT_1074848 [Mycena vulgaris]